jgi:hypothetical protein
MDFSLFHRKFRELDSDFPPLFLPITAYPLSSTKLEIRGKIVSAGIEGMGGRGKGQSVG